jgi:hypothetical protein
MQFLFYFIFFFRKKELVKMSEPSYYERDDADDQADQFQETHFGSVDQSNKNEGGKSDWTTTRSTK